MKLWFRNFRIGILNWLAAGRITIVKDKKPQENNNMSYTLGGTQAGTTNINPSGYSTQLPQSSQTITIKITPANGGTIVQMSANEYTNGELYIIADGEDFDRELGKIITMSKLKA
jgi:hypothetical protein